MWLVSIATLINLVVIWYMPKRLTWQEIYATWGVMAALTLITDLALGTKTSLYNILGEGLQKRAMATEVLLPPAFGVIWLNFMPKQWSRFILYVVFVVLVSDGFELLTVWSGYITYGKWNLWYSSLVYLAGMLFLRWHLSFLRRPADRRAFLR